MERVTSLQGAAGLGGGHGGGVSRRVRQLLQLRLQSLPPNPPHPRWHPPQRNTTPLSQLTMSAFALTPEARKLEHSGASSATERLKRCEMPVPANESLILQNVRFSRQIITRGPRLSGRDGTAGVHQTPSSTHHSRCTLSLIDCVDIEEEGVHLGHEMEVGAGLKIGSPAFLNQSFQTLGHRHSKPAPESVPPTSSVHCSLLNTPR